MTAVSSGAATAAARAEDASARRAAQRVFDRPLLLEAGAGTGKTATLVARAIAWCMGPGWEQHSEAGEPGAIAARVLARVVAITFTEAAAAEMAERVAGALASIERGALPPGVDAALLELHPDSPLRARALIGALDRLSVQTIHAWCRRLLAGFPVEAGMHPGFDVDADGALRERVVREVLESRLGSAYTDEGDRAYLELAAEGIGPPEIESALRTLAEEAVPAGAFDAEPLSAERIRGAVDDGIALLAAWTATEGGRMAALSHARRSAETARRLARALDTMRAAGDVSLDGIAELCDRMGEIYDPPTDERLRAWAGDRLTPAERRALAALAPRFVEHSRELRSWLRHFTSLRPRRLALARRVVGPLHSEVERQMRARGGVSFNHLLSEARTLVLERDSVARRIRRGIDQLLVDEFQDTDRAQCDLVARIALDGEREERPGLFVVGDPKQSIYGWRSADLAAYDGFVDRLRAEGGEVRSLSVNFRSVPAVLDEVDRVMHDAMRERRGVQPRFAPLVACEGREDEPGFGGGAFAPVEHWVAWRARPGGGLDPRTRMREATRTEAQALARDLRALHDTRGVEWGTIAVLFRSRADLDTYLSALRHADIPYAVEGDRGFYQRREIIEAAALVRCVLDPNDQLSLITWLRSATVGVPDCAWIPLWDRELPALVARLREPDDDGIEAVRDVIAGVAEILPGDVPGLERIAGWERSLGFALRGLAALRASFRKDPGDVFVEKLRALTLIEATEAARYQGAYRVANLDRFFRELTRDLCDGGAGTQEILRRLRTRIAEAVDAEEGRPEAGAAPGVRVMTIHQSKGLGFDHVYVVQLHKGQPWNPLWDGTLAARVDGNWEYSLFGAATPKAWRVEAARAEVDAAERVRTLYVAMTRAKDRLVLSGVWPEGRDTRPPEQARNHLDLLLHRAPGVPDLAQLAESISKSGKPDRGADANAARWRFPALEPPADGGAGAGDPGPLQRTEPAAVRAEAGLLRARRAAASARMARAFAGPATDEAHRRLHELRAEPAGGTRREPGPGERIAMAAGSAVHRVLEDLDLRAAPETERPRAEATLRSCLERLLTRELRERAFERANDCLERLWTGPLLERLRDLAGSVVARELPLIAPSSGETGPLEVVSGAVDLLYRDPRDGGWVVADYKTDPLETDAAIAERATVYASQGAVYKRAVQEALDLDSPPRFELWFLHSGRVVEA